MINMNEIKIETISGTLTIESKIDDRINIRERYNKYIRERNIIVNHRFFKSKDIEDRNPFKLINDCQIVYDNNIGINHTYNVGEIINYLKIYIDKKYGIFNNYNINGICQIYTNAIYLHSRDVLYTGSLKSDSPYNYIEFCQIMINNSNFSSRHINLWSDWETI